MPDTFLAQINAATKSQISDHERYRRVILDENSRRERRSTGSPLLLTAKRPQLWDEDPGYDPYHVRKNASSISHAVVRSLRNDDYTPRPPVGFEVPKADGQKRIVSAFQIADEVVSRRLLKSLSRKNEARFSARAYGYRSRLTVHDAIAYISTEFRLSRRLFVAEFDFSKFFDRIRHEYVWESIRRLGIVMTSSEQRNVEAFLESPVPRLIGDSIATHPRLEGLPQGTSVSLFLANVVASELDRRLERLGVGFARYADDTLIWSEDYSRVTQAVTALYESSRDIGSPINSKKSPGVSLLVPVDSGPAEIRSVVSVDFLGHSVTLDKISIRDSAVSRIKRNVQALLFNNLLREPLRRQQSLDRFSRNDKDYATFVWQLRRYMYGPLSEEEVRRFQAGKIRPMSFEGVMSFFPLVDDDCLLQELDQWLSLKTWQVVRKREKLLQAAGLPTPLPIGLSRGDLIGFKSVSSRTGETVDLRLPSFQRMSGVIRTVVRTFGLSESGRGRTEYHYGDTDA